MNDHKVLESVRQQYGAVGGGDFSGAEDAVRRVATAFGYSPEQLASIPAEANLGLSCGNPTAAASLRPGETVVDLGCGGGLDVFLAAQRVGPTGKAIGIDMTEEMIGRARRIAARGGPDGAPFTNVEFHLATIDRLPLQDASVDCIISNCVINLAPDKGAVFREAFRVLKPGGRLAVSDIALKQPLPEEIADDVMAYVGCIAGAISPEAYRQGLTAAGFDAVEVIDSGADLNAYGMVEGQSACCSPAMSGGAPADLAERGSLALPMAEAGCCGGESTSPDGQTAIHSGLAELLRRYDLNHYAASVRVFAVKG